MERQKLAFALIGFNILFLIIALSIGIAGIGFVAKRLVGALASGEAKQTGAPIFELKAFEELGIAQ